MSVHQSSMIVMRMQTVVIYRTTFPQSPLNLSAVNASLVSVVMEPIVKVRLSFSKTCYCVSASNVMHVYMSTVQSIYFLKLKYKIGP